MLLTRQSQIAVDILVACARRHPGTLRTEDAAVRSATTRDHAAQVVQLLTKAGLIIAHRGRRGGLTLAHPAHTIGVGQVLRVVQPDLFGEVDDGDDAYQEGGSARNFEPASRTVDLLLSEISKLMHAVLDHHSIADLAVDRDQDSLRALIQKTCDACPVPTSIFA